MGITRRALVTILSAVGITGRASAEEDPDTAATSYGTVPYAEQGYGGMNAECFIASAACGTSEHADVIALRNFRDTYLRTTIVGRAFVRIYYATSPPLARWISRDARRQRIVRQTLVRPASQLVQQLR